MFNHIDIICLRILFFYISNPRDYIIFAEILFNSYVFLWNGF